MSNILTLVSPIPPSVNHYLAHRAMMKGGRPVATVYESAEAKKYKKEFKEYVIEQADKQNWDVPLNKYQNYYVDCVFYFPRVDMDPNNMFKCTLDAITETGVVWFDDNTVCERVQRIYYDQKNPRIEMKIYPVDYVGIFNNHEQLAEFEKKCRGCKRFQKNCSLLRNTKIGKIQDGIYCDGDKFICDKFCLCE